MRPVRLLAVLSVLLLTLWMAPASAQAPLVTVASFTPPNLPEGVTVDRQGNIYVSMAPTGELWRFGVDGRQSTFATFRLGEGFLLGLTTDLPGNVYAAVVSGDAPGTDTQGIWRVRPSGSKELVAALPGGLPNDVKFDAAGNLFVSDSGQGLIWRIGADGRPSRWLEHTLLRGHGEGVGPVCPGVELPFVVGANGLAFAASGDLFVVNTEFGRIIRVPVLADGRAGVPQIFVEHCSLLAGADGLTIDRAGNLYVAVNLLSTIVRVSPTGVLDVLATAADGLDNPASVAFGMGADQDTLYITNFALFTAMSGGTPRPGLLALAVQVPLPKDTPKKG